jgi:hypothetical protein
MPKTILNLKQAIAAFTRRSITSFQSAEGDSLLVAINHAKDFAQRGVDFERAMTKVQVTVPDMTVGGLLSTAKRLPDNLTPVQIKTVRYAFLPNAERTLYVPVNIYSRSTYVDMLRRRSNPSAYSLQERESDQLALRQDMPLGVVLFGDDQFEVTPINSSLLGNLAAYPVQFDVIEWLPDFTQDTDSSFLLTYCFDFMMFRSIMELNYLLKEDQRFSVSTTILGNAWESVKEWNSKIVGNTTDVTLD